MDFSVARTLPNLSNSDKVVQAKNVGKGDQNASFWGTFYKWYGFRGVKKGKSCDMGLGVW